MIKIINKIRAFCVIATAIVVIGSNIVNYFYCYRHLNDLTMQWRVAMTSISLVMFLMSLYIWLTETLKKNNLKRVISGWIALYILFDFIGILLGYSLHTRAFVDVLFITAILGTIHLIIRLWAKYC